MAAPVIGIDLGTTNSCCAVADENGEIELIPYRGGEFTIPSLFAVDEKGNHLVGYEAKRQWELNPRNTIHGAKRMLGVNYGSELVRRVREHITYEILEGSNNDVGVKVAGNTMTLPQVSARVLAKIREVASEHLGVPVAQAVVTVPAYYNDRQRQCVREAGKLAELEILHILNEPTAAALAYGANRSLNQTVVVYDLGGGTFDISVIDIRDRVFEVKATGGDIFLGGMDFDNALIEYVLNDFSSKHKVDLRSDPIAMQRIRDMGERIKVDLSSRAEAPMNIPFITMTPQGQPLDINLIIRREELEVLVEPLLQRTFDVCMKVLDDAGVTVNQVNGVLLVGGQTRMPVIQARITELFGRAPSKAVHPDEAVAVGAAMYAWSLSAQSDRRIQLLDVLPMAIGIERADKKLHRLFERNGSVPNRRAFTFTTHKDNQRDLMMRLFQGDAEAAQDNQLLGEFVFTGLRTGPAGSVRVEVVFDVSSEGILSLDAKDLDSGATMKQVVRFGATAT